MEPLPETEIKKFLKENIEPLPNVFYGTGYSASVCLVDRTFLPCVIFRNPKTIVDLAIKRFEKERTDEIMNPEQLGYFDIVKGFVARGNCINAHEVGKVEISRFAFPFSILKQIRSETRMGWTAFVVKMKNGKCFNFGTTFSLEFFNLPEGYCVEDIDEIINHSYVLKTGEIESYYATAEKTTNEHKDVVYRERPYFVCYLDNL